MAADGFGGAQRSLVADAQLIQDYLQSPSIPVSLENNGERKVAPFQNVEGQAEAFAIDMDGAVFHVCRQKQSDSGWNIYGIGAGFKQIAGVDSATVWGVGYDGTVWQNHHGIWTGADSVGEPATAVSVGTDRTVWGLDTAGNLFVASPPSALAPTVSSQIAPALILDSCARLNFFCVDADGDLWTAQQSAWGCGWRAWKNLGNGQPITRIEIASNADGRLQAFAIGSDANLWTAWQQTLGGDWSGWRRLGSAALAILTLAVGQNQDGRLEVFAIAKATLEIQHMWQLAPNQGWNDWTDWGAGTGALDLAVALASNGCLALAAIYPAGQPATITTQTQPNGRWGPPQPVGMPYSVQPIEPSQPFLARNADGHLELFAVTQPGGNIYHTWETQGVWTGTWVGFGNPTGFSVFDYAIGTNEDGRLELFAASITGVSHIWQTTPNGSWSAWSQLQAPASAPIETQAVACDAFGLLNLIGLTSASGSAAIAQRPAGDWASWTGWASNWRSWYPVASVPPLAGAPAGTAADIWAISQTGDLVHSHSGACDTVAMPGGARPACLAAGQDGTEYVLTTDGALFAQPAGGAEFISLPENLAATSIGVTSATILAMSANSGLNRWRQDGWQAVNSPLLTGDGASRASAPQVSVGVDGTVWVLDATGSIWKQGRIGPSIAVLACPAPAGTQLRSLSAALVHAAWGVDANGAVLQSLGGAWSRFSSGLPSGPAAQASSRADGSIFAIDTTGAPYQYINNAWEPLNGGFDGALVQSPTMWAATAHSAFNDQALGQWVCLLQEFDKTITQISAAGDGTVVVLLTDGTLAPVENPNAPILNGAPADLVQIAIVNADSAWALTQDPVTKRCSLHLFSEGAWSPVPTALALLSGGDVAPQLGSASDGTTWLLDASGVPRQLTYSPEKVTWDDKTRSTTFQSVSAVTGSAVQTTTAEMHEAWAVTTEGEFRRSFGEGWRDAGMALPAGATATGIFAGGYSWLAALDQQNNLYRNEAQTQLPKAPGLAIGVVAAAQDGGGILHVFSLDRDGQVWVARELPGMAGGAPMWADFQQLASSQAMTNVIAGQDQDGTLEAFCIGSDGLLYHAWQDESGGGWSAFWKLGETGQPPGVQLTALACGRDASKLLWIFALGRDGNIWRIVQQPGSSTGWGGWTVFPAGPSGPFFNLAVGNDPGGALEVFATGEQYDVHHAWQDAQSATGWSGWWQLGSPGVFGAGVSQGQVAAGVAPDGVLHVFAISFDGRSVYEIHGQPPGWSGWTVVSTFSALWALSLAFGTGADGAFMLLVQGSDGAIYASSRQADGSWSPHMPIGAMATDGEPLGSLTVANGDGALHVFAAGTASVWHNRPQPDSPTGWGDWGRLSGPQSWTRFGAEPIRQLVGNASGGFYALFQDGTIHWSLSGTDWSAMAFPGDGTPSQAALSVSAGIDGTLWAVTADACYRNDSEQGAWQAVGVGSFSAAPVGSAADLWSLDPDGMVWRSSNGGATWRRETSVTQPTRQLSMCSDGSVWRLDADGTTSLATAWERLMRPTGMAGYALPAPAIGVDTIVDKWGKRLLLIAGQDGLLRYSYEAARDVWTPIEVVPDMTTNGWGAIRTPPNDDVLVYSFWNETNSVGAALWSQGQFTYIAVRASDNIRDLEVSSDGEYLYWIANGDRGISIAVTTAEDFSQLDFNPIHPQPQSIACFLRTPWGRSAQDLHFLLADGDGQIWVGAVTGALTGNPTANYIQLTDLGDVQPNAPAVIAPMLQARRWTAPQPRIYVLSNSAAVPGTNVLWAIARGNLFKSAADSAEWNRWVPLAGSYFNAYPGSADAALDTVFVLDSEGNLGFVRQDATSGQWRRGLTQRPSWAGADIIEIATYSSEITILGANGAPEPNLAVTVFAEWPVDAWINKTLYRLDPVEAVTVTPDRTGRIRVKSPAPGLTFPKLTFQAEGLGGLRGAARARLGDGGATVDPSQRVFGYLSGTGTLPVNGGQPSQFSSCALLNARPDNQAFAKLSTTDDAKKAYSTITQTAGLAQNAASPEAVPAWLRPAVPRAVGSAIGDFFDDLGHGLETAADFIINGVAGAAIEIVDDAVQFTITLANGVETVIKWVVKTAKDALAAIEAIAVLVLDDLEKFIDWLKLLFDWGNILKTQAWLKQLLQQASTALPSVIADLAGIAQQKFAETQQQFGSSIDQLIQDKVPGYASFGDLPSSYSSSSSASPAEVLLGDATQPIANSSKVHNNWVLDQVLDHILPSFAIPAIPGLGNPFASFSPGYAFASLAGAGQNLVDFAQTLIEDPTRLPSTGIVDLLEAVKDLVNAALQLIEDLIKTFLQCATTVFDGLMTVLDTPVHIPLLDDLFKFITGGQELTLFNLVTLILAAPAYVLSELIFGAAPYDGLTEAASGALGGRTAIEAWAAVYLLLGLIGSGVEVLWDFIVAVVGPTGFDPLDPTPVVLPFLICICSLLKQIAAWPGQKGFPFVSGGTVDLANSASDVNYAVSWMPPILGIMVAAAKSFPDYNDISPTEIQLLRTLIGCIGLANGIIACALGGTASPGINGAKRGKLAIKSLPLALSFLMIPAIRAQSLETIYIDTAWLMLVLDLLVNVSTAILQEVGANT